MPRPRSPEQVKYRVLNPRGLAQGTRIFAFTLNEDPQTIFEAFGGDEITIPAGVPSEDVENLLERGFLEVVDG